MRNNEAARATAAPSPRTQTRHEIRRDEALAPSPTDDHPNTPAASPRRRRTRPRLNAFDYVGRYAYHIVTVTHGRAPVLVDDCARAIVDDLHRAAEATHFELLVYTVMPDHVHVLALGADDQANTLRFVQRFKQLTGFRFRRQDGPFWQQSFFDHVVRSNEDVLPIARYILENPQRAGLALADVEWPYQGGTLVSAAIATSQERDGAEAASLRAQFGGERDGAKAASLHAHCGNDGPPPSSAFPPTAGDTP